MKRSRLVIALVLVIAFIAPIGAAFSTPNQSSPDSSDARVEINVLAASSLSSAFTAIADEFMNTHNITVTLSFAGSSTLATQIEEGAPVDVVAMADNTNMNRIVSTGNISESSVTTFARNQLTILTAKDNPQAITSLRDLTRRDLTVVLCDVSQPCGRYAAELFSNAGITVEPSSRESSVSGVISRIRTGEADAGIGYASDLVANEDLSGVTIPAADNIVATYPVAIASQPSSGSSTAAQVFVDFLMSEKGQTLLSSFGFERAK